MHAFGSMLSPGMWFRCFFRTDYVCGCGVKQVQPLQRGDLPAKIMY